MGKKDNNVDRGIRAIQAINIILQNIYDVSKIFAKFDDVYLIDESQ